MLEEKALDAQLERCLSTWGISLLEEWDLLVFLHRHRKSLLTVEQISSLLGNDRTAVHKALRKFETAGLVRRSRSLQGIRFNQLVASLDEGPQEALELLVHLFINPLVRGIVAARLARSPTVQRGLRRTGLYLT